MLLKHRPSDIEADEFKKLWENAAYTLQPLYDVLKNIVAAKHKVSEEDFGTANHYALLAYRAGQIEMAERILDMLPKGCSE